MKSKAFLCLFLLLLVSYGIDPTVEHPQGGASPPPPLLFSGGGGASEEETIDTFDTHYKYRWSKTSAGGMDIDVDGLLNISNLGDGGGAYFYLERDLDKLHDKIQILFKVDSDNTGAASSDNRLDFILYSQYFTTDPITFTVQTTNGNCSTYIKYKDTSSTERSLNLTYPEVSSNAIVANKWYRFRLDYDLIKSKLRYRLYFRNNTRVFDYDFFDIHSQARPEIFTLGNHTLTLRLYSTVKTLGEYHEYLIEYVKAPFKSRQWVQTDTPSDPQWLTDAWDHAVTEDDIDPMDHSNWTLTVPYLDGFSGNLWYDQGQAIGSTMYVIADIRLFSINRDTGALTKLAAVAIQQHSIGGLNIEAGIRDADSFYDYSFAKHQYDTIIATSAVQPHIAFSFALSDDRSDVRVSAKSYLTTTQIEEHYYETSVPSGASQEFLIEIAYSFQYITNIDEVALSVTDFDFITQNIFTDFVNFISGIGELILAFLTSIFIVLFKFIAVVFTAVGEVITAAVEALAPLISAVQGVIEDAISAIGNIANQIWTSLGTFIDDIINDYLFPLAEDIADLIDAILAWLIPLLILLGEEFAEFVEEILKFLIPLVQNLITILLELGWAFFYGLAEALGIEDIFTIGEVLFTGFLQFITNLPQFINDWVGFLTVMSVLFGVLGFIWIFILPVAIADSPGEFIDVMFDHAMTDLSGGLSVLGFYIPVPFVIPWALIIIFNFLSGTFYFGFF